jgi:ribosomal protein L4
MRSALNGLGVDNALVILDSAGMNEKRAAANIENIKMLSSGNVSLFDILKHDWLVMDKSAVKNIEGRLSVK